MIDIRPSEPADIPGLRAIEDDAALLFESLPTDVRTGYSRVMEMEPAPLEEFERAHHDRLLTVATLNRADESPEVVGFALCRRPSNARDTLHLQELDVARSAQGHGIGRRLLEATVALARHESLGRVTLTTYRDIPWNAPWYARCGFEELPEAHLDDFLRSVRDKEIEAGLDQSPRVAMQLLLCSQTPVGRDGSEPRCTD